jgi:hypothetical protein
VPKDDAKKVYSGGETPHFLTSAADGDAWSGLHFTPWEKADSISRTGGWMGLTVGGKKKNQ